MKYNPDFQALPSGKIMFGITLLLHTKLQGNENIDVYLTCEFDMNVGTLRKIRHPQDRLKLAKSNK